MRKRRLCWRWLCWLPHAVSDPGLALLVSRVAHSSSRRPWIRELSSLRSIATTQAKQITEQIYDYLADVGTDLNTHDEKGFRRGLADGWRWSPDSLSLAFHINPRARWHDGRAVTARDVQFTFGLNKNPALGGSAHSESGKHRLR